MRSLTVTHPTDREAERRPQAATPPKGDHDAFRAAGRNESLDDAVERLAARRNASGE